MRKTGIVIVALIASLTASLRAEAQDLSAAEFSKEFVVRVNTHLSVVNQERKKAQKNLYCAGLDQRQVQLVEKTASQKDVTVGEFVKKVSENLKCYPPFWEPWGQKNVRGILFNTKSFVLDTVVIREVLEDMAGGRVVYDTESLLEFPNAW